MFEAEEGYFQRVKIPWHASFYEKYGLEYLNKCMGTIITTSHVLSAANCFWDDGLRKLNPASKYAVVGGALVDAWDRLDGAVHKSKIKDIKIPVDYTGHKTNYQNDIALVFLSTPFVYDLRIRPVCLDFDMEFDKKQLIPGNLGIFTGHLNFDEPPFLLVASYIDSGTCAGMASSWHRKYITSDKICGKISFDDMNNRLPAGQGLAFPATEGGQRRYYLRGVLSVGLYPPHNSVRDLYVTSKNLLAFTHLLAHKTFIKDSITVEKYRTSIAQIMCRLPSYPKYGSYTVINNPNFSPGDSIDSFYLDYKCDTGYGIVGSNKLFCVNGFQHQQVPKCEKMCFLNRHASVEYLCHDGQLCGKTRKCRIQEPEGITATPVCKTPIYNTSHSLPIMKCSNSTWNYVATCPAAAHCFWNDTRQSPEPAARFAVAAGALSRAWGADGAQGSDVSKIEIPDRFRGAYTNYQDDIALLVLAGSLTYGVGVRPVCLELDAPDDAQLTPGNLGTIAGWGWVDESGTETQTLNVVKLPYIDVKKCLDEAPPDFREYITSDKICAGYTNGTGLCHGDSGGGLAFATSVDGETRYFLRGIASSAPTNKDDCNVHAVTSFTDVQKHAKFLKAFYAGP